MATRSSALLLAMWALASCAGPSHDIAPDPNLSCAASPVVAAATSSDKANPNPDRGMGGTGLFADTAGDERGMGGTGIVGTVTGFGSICVNGFRIAYDDATPVSIDGAPATVARLGRGQTVLVDARETGGRLAARSIDVQSAIVGPVTAVSDASLTVMTATVAIDTATVVAGAYRIGDTVAVSGLQRADGGLSATRIEPVSGGRAAVRGYVTAVGRGAVTVGSVPVAQATVPAGVSVGAWVAVDGTWTGVAIEPRRVSVGVDLPPATDRLSIEGFVEAAPAGGYMVRGVPLGANVRVGLDSPTIARLAGPTRVQIIGQVERGQSVTPSTIIVPDAANPLVRPNATPIAPPAGVQNMRGTYGRPLDPAQRPEGLPQRPTGTGRPTAAPPVVRPEVPVRPETPTRPEAPVRPEAPNRPGRPGFGG